VKVIVHNLPYMQTTTIVFATNHGSMHDRKSGLTALLVRLLIKRTKKHSERELNILIDGNGRELFHKNRKDHSYIGIRSMPEDFDNSLSLLSEIICNLEITEKDLVLEKQNLAQDIRTKLDTVGPYMLSHLIGKTVFGENHPSGKNTEGYPEELEKISLEEIKHLYQANFFVNTVCLVFGNLKDQDNKAVKTKIERHFSNLSNIENQTNLTKSAVNLAQSNYYFQENSNKKNVYLCLNCFVEPDFHNPLIMRFLGSAISGSWNSVLFREIRIKRGLSYIVLNLTESVEDVGIVSFIIDVDESKIIEALEVMYKTIKDQYKEIFLKNEFEVQKGTFRTTIYEWLELSQDYATIVIDGYYHNGPTSYEELEKQIDELNSSDIQNWCLKILKPDNLSLSLEGNFDKDEVLLCWNRLIKEESE